jgi:hypothetical protein
MPDYPFGGWKDILKVLYMGYVDPGLGHSLDPEVGKNCNSGIRRTLANNWGQIFELQGCDTSGCATGIAGTNGTIKGLWHLFRLDDAIDTNAIFAELLDFAAPDPRANPVAASLGGYALGSDPFCNSLANQPGALPWKGSNNPNIIPNDHQDYDPIRRPCQGRGTDITVNNRTEQVCERGTFDAPGTAALPGGTCNTSSNNCPPDPDGRGLPEQCLGGQCWGSPSLGLLLPLVTTTRLANESTLFNSQYDLVPAAPGANPTIVNRCNGTQSVSWLHVPRTNGAGNTSGLCPNGDPSAMFAGVCVVPADATGNPNCISFKADLPPQLVACPTQGENTGPGGYSACSGFGPNPGGVDTRVYNLYAYVFNSATGLWTIDTDDSGRPVTGAFYRIHESQALLSPNTPSIIASPPAPIATPQTICTYQSATDQLGCLVQADPCSFGVAGRESTFIVGPNVPTGTSTMTLSAGGSAMNVNGIQNSPQCIAANYQYPLARKVYLNSIVGFGNASFPELGLAECESTPSLIAQGIAANGLVPLSIITPNGGAPYCEDFNEQMWCGAATNRNACADNNSLPGLPGSSVSTTCGNGIQEALEQCDLGVSGNGPPPATCSRLCRANF